MLPYPQIDPVVLAIGPLKIHWYGLMYLIGIGGAWLLASRRLNRFDPTWNKEKLSDLVFWPVSYTHLTLPTSDLV